VQGSLQNATWARGPWGAELAFDASPWPGVKFGLIPGSTSLSIAAVVRLDSSGSLRTILSKRTGTDPAWQFRVATTGVLAFSAGGAFEDSSLVVPLGEYVAVGVTKSSGSAPTFYLFRANGLSIHSPSTNLSIVESAQTVWLGSGGNASDTPVHSWLGRITSCVWRDGELSRDSMARLLSDLWSGDFAAIRPESLPVRFAGQAPPPAPAQGSRLVRWFPGLSRRMVRG
jgi:hypothetical protein